MIAAPAFLLAAGNEAVRIPLAMLLVFGSAKLLAELCERFGQPGIVGEILAGVLIGPSVLGWVAPNDFLQTMASMGAMFLLFRVGLEVKSSELMRVGGTATVVATAGVILPFFLGWGILALWGATQIEAIFMGAAMVATSVGITARVLASRGLLAERSSKVILAAAVIDDVLGLLVLAAVSSLARGKVNVLEIALIATLAIGFTVIVATLGSRAMGRIVPRVQTTMQSAEAEFALSLVLLFALSLLAVYVGVAAIVGAFLAGMALAEHVEARVHDLVHGVSELLVPFFLVGIGLHVDLRVFTSPAVLLLALIILLAAVFSKFVGCGLAALKLGRSDALRIGVGMVPRGEVGMVVAQLGLAMGVIRQNTYAVAVFMAVATTLVAPLLINAVYRSVAPLQRGDELQRRDG
jgi:Kef-type K+ transport system membrane component KefB